MLTSSQTKTGFLVFRNLCAIFKFLLTGDNETGRKSQSQLTRGPLCCIF